MISKWEKSKSRTLAAIIVLLLCFPGAAAAAPPAITAGAAVLMDVDSGQIYYARKHTQRAYPASLTKIMTALVALENGNPGDVVTVRGGAAAISMGSIIDLRKGDKVTLDELLKAALICSANDSTVAIAEHVGGSHERFIMMMNTKAAALGLFGTRFRNTNGYHDPNHYTTAYDLALLTKCALGNPRFNELVQTRETTMYWVEPPDREEKLRNSNRLLFDGYEGIDGVKTGTTPIAGNCLVASATREGRRLIAAALNSSNRYEDCIRMFDFGFKVVKPVIAAGASEKIADVAVTGGYCPEVEVVAERDLEVRLDPDDLPNLERKVEVSETLPAPLKKGQKLGEAVFSLNGQELGRVGLVAGKDVPRTGWHRQVWDKVFN